MNGSGGSFTKRSEGPEFFPDIHGFFSDIHRLRSLFWEVFPGHLPIARVDLREVFPGHPPIASRFSRTSTNSRFFPGHPPIAKADLREWSGAARLQVVLAISFSTASLLAHGHRSLGQSRTANATTRVRVSTIVQGSARGIAGAPRAPRRDRKHCHSAASVAPRQPHRYSGAAESAECPRQWRLSYLPRSDDPSNQPAPDTPSG